MVDILAERTGALVPRVRRHVVEARFASKYCITEETVLYSAETDQNLMPYVVYILECSDGSYYTGSAADLGRRLWEHESGASRSAYTFSRRPVKLVWTSEEVARYSDALRFERQIKGWSRSKKKALIDGHYEAVHEFVQKDRKQRERRKRESSR